jgi:hypothetical protein
MSQKPKGNSPFRKLFKKAEHAVEKVVDHSDSDSDHDKKKHHYHHHHYKEHHEDEKPNITINVNVDGCCSSGTKGPGTGGKGGTQPPGRPTHQTGTTDGSIDGGLGAPGGIIGIATRPPNVWPGPRTRLYLPFLFIRANVGDCAARPLTGTFWESPDILIMPGLAPANAPDIPPDLGGIAKPNTDNTVYAHVWNLGQAPCHGALVEFYWFNPTMGFNGSDAHLMGKTYVDLGPRGGPGCHKLVKCPSSWIAQFVNGGHECLVVRISHVVTDPLSSPAWDASQNRHIGQRNIHVMTAAEAAAKPTLGINVGPLFGQPGQVKVDRANTTTMPWLHLATNSRTNVPATANATGDVGITPPVAAGIVLPNLGAVPNPRGVGLIGDSHGVTGDDKQVGFVATDGDPGNGNAHVYRVSGTQNGNPFGGYTVVVLGG